MNDYEEVGFELNEMWESETNKPSEVLQDYFEEKEQEGEALHDKYAELQDRGLFRGLSVQRGSVFSAYRE